MSPIPSDPLTDGELEELDRFLLDNEGIEESMDISMLDGYLAALLSGPTTILPSEWLRWVWDVEKGEDSPVFSSTAGAQRIMNLIMRHMNDVTLTLIQAPEEYEPLILESRDERDPVPVIDQWCVGYMKGVSLDPQGWPPVTAGHPEWMPRSSSTAPRRDGSSWNEETFRSRSTGRSPPGWRTRYGRSTPTSSNSARRRRPPAARR